MRLRRLVIATHRDLGYFFAGLTVIYAVSGVAVNHVHHWNPSFSERWAQHQLGTLPRGSNEEVASAVLERLQVDEQPISMVRMGPKRLEIYFEGRTLKVDLPSGTVTDERIRPRPGLFEVNYLHLNNGKGAWTWIADAYAVGLLTLAMTGIFILKGKKGLGGRGRWLLLAGIAVPIVFLILRLS